MHFFVSGTIKDFKCARKCFSIILNGFITVVIKRLIIFFYKFSNTNYRIFYSISLLDMLSKIKASNFIYWFFRPVYRSNIGNLLRIVWIYWVNAYLIFFHFFWWNFFQSWKCILKRIVILPWVYLQISFGILILSKFILFIYDGALIQLVIILSCTL